LFNLNKKLTKETELLLWLSDPSSYMANPERARLREFHPLELTPARAAPCHGGQPESPAAQ
jgi:hypothetical protein